MRPIAAPNLPPGPRLPVLQEPQLRCPWLRLHEVISVRHGFQKVNARMLTRLSDIAQFLQSIITAIDTRADQADSRQGHGLVYLRVSSPAL